VNRRRLGSLIGVAIGVLGLIFVGLRLAQDWDAVTAALGTANWSLVIVGLVLGLVGMSTIGLNWTLILRRLGAAESPIRTRLHQYFVGQLGKYVPGGIWPIVGRAEMAHRGGTARTPAYAGTLLSLASTYLAALLTAALFLVVAVARGAGSGWEVWVIALVPIGILLLHPKAMSRAVGILSRLTRRDLELPIPSWKQSITMVALHIPSWLAISAATYTVSEALGGDLAFDRIGVATCVAWFLGFVVIGLPGGIGVREAVFVSLTGPLGPSLAAAVALVSRVVFVLVDLMGAGASTGWHWSRSSETPTPGRD
jgi:uncharacterized membrane protein YbhN (UPF0104 family)